MFSAKLCPEGTVASLEGSLASPKGNRMRKNQDIKKWKTKDPFKVCDRLSWKPKGYFTVRDCGVGMLGWIFSPVIFKCYICSRSPGWIRSKVSNPY